MKQKYTSLYSKFNYMKKFERTKSKASKTSTIKTFKKQISYPKKHPFHKTSVHIPVTYCYKQSLDEHLFGLKGWNLLLDRIIWHKV